MLELIAQFLLEQHIVVYELVDDGDCGFSLHIPRRILVGHVTNRDNLPLFQFQRVPSLQGFQRAVEAYFGRLLTISTLSNPGGHGLVCTGTTTLSSPPPPSHHVYSLLKRWHQERPTKEECCVCWTPLVLEFVLTQCGHFLCPACHARCQCCPLCRQPIVY